VTYEEDKWLLAAKKLVKETVKRGLLGKNFQAGNNYFTDFCRIFPALRTGNPRPRGNLKHLEPAEATQT
jgi:hypothetical protein